MSFESEIDDILNPLLATFSGSLTANVEGELATIYVSGTSQVTKWAGKKFEGPPMEEAVKFARKRGSWLVTEMEDDTRRRLRNVIAKGIRNKRGIPGLSRDIRREFTHMTKYRSRLIAHTETANALGESFTKRGKELGITGKEWITVGDNRVSPECQGNEAVGVIPFDQAFPAGAMTPPQHPGCRCAAAPVMLPS